MREAGKTLPAAISEVREAADMCRYYAAIARKLFGQPETLPGPTGESNQLSLHGRGVFVCISPWNFPLAIFTGQVAAALAAGNAVIAKPADQTVLIGHAAVKLLHEAGVPADVLQFVPGKGSMIGNTLLTKPDVAGVCMTGSTETAWTINRTLAARNAQIASLIAETGGQNALIADSSALPEQLVKDVVASAFDSAGQRCSAARVLFVQEDIADKVITMLAGAMDELKVGDPGLLSTDVGPVIDEPSRKNLVDHAARMDAEAKLIRQVTLAGRCRERHVLRAARVRAQVPVAAHARSLRPGAARAALEGRRARQGHRRDQRDRLRPHARHPQPHRLDDRAHHTTRKSRQLLRQPQPDRRGRRRAAVRRRGPVGYRTEGRRAALPVALRHRAHADGQHDRSRRQCVVADSGRVKSAAASSETSRTFYRLITYAAVAVAAVALLDLAVRAAVRLEPRWDTFMYHLPFAALRGGLGIDYDFNELMRHRYEGFPFLPHLVQGLLWRLSGTANATGVVNFLAFGIFLAYTHFMLRARFWIVALVSLTAPLVVIHAACSYIDLFGNCFLAIATSSCLYLYLFPQQRSQRIFVGGLIGLVLAAWSKYQLVPVVALFTLLFGALALAGRDSAREGSRRRMLLLVASAAVLVALPYAKNLVVYGNPFWPIRVPLFGDLFPYMEVGDNNLSQQPLPLRGRSQFILFLHSILEIDHPTSYPDRPRWIIDQGNAFEAFRSGGFWWAGTLFSMVSLTIMLVVRAGRRGVAAAIGVLGVLLFVSVLPQSHELRYYLFLPLTWAGAIGFLYADLQPRWPGIAAAFVVIVLVLFGYMGHQNRVHYAIESRNYVDAARYWRASNYWTQMSAGKTYCAVDMVPLPFMMTGPTGKEFTIADRLREYGCPDGSIVIRQGVPQHALGGGSLIDESLALYRAGNFADSLSAAERSLQFEPTSAIAYNNICAGYLALDKRRPAIEACQSALRLAPDFELARNNLAAALRQPNVQH